MWIAFSFTPSGWTKGQFSKSVCNLQIISAISPKSKQVLNTCERSCKSIIFSSSALADKLLIVNVLGTALEVYNP